MVLGVPISIRLLKATSNTHPKLKRYVESILHSPSRPQISYPGKYIVASFVRSTHDKPLRILFCGADELSIVSLQALHKESQQSPSNVASIEVVCRPGKATGRGLKQIRHPPIKEAAEKLGLSVHQINTFTGWELPSDNSYRPQQVDLVVAVSFGLLIPSRILNGATYGGINVHPSLLPSFRGPAPLHWIILRGETKTGVTLQTLHPTKFDAGVVLDQTPEPGVPIANPATYTYEDLRSMSSALAAEMLIKAVRERSFIPPNEDVRNASVKSAIWPTSFAPKIKSIMRYVDFENMTSSQILRMNRAIAPLRTEARPGRDDSTTSMIFHPNMHLANMPDLNTHEAMTIPSIEPGLPYALLDEQNHIGGTSAPLMVNTIDKRTLIIPMIKLPGTSYRPAAALAQTAGFLAEPSQRHGKWVREFYKTLRLQEDTQQYLESLWNAA